MIVITKSVGEKGANLSVDVKKIQAIINYNLHLLPKVKKLKEDGKVGSLTISAIRAYQAEVVKMLKPDERVDPNGKTLKSLEKTARKPRPANVKAFINETLQAAKKIKTKYKIPVSILIAQAALESGWGRHVKDNAYFGIKSHKSKGAVTSFTTTEFINGKKVTMKDSFRAYASFDEAAEDYGKFLTTNSRYKSAFAHSNDPYKFANILQSSGYATDPQYAKKLQSIISTYYLDDYDK